MKDTKDLVEAVLSPEKSIVFLIKANYNRVLRRTYTLQFVRSFIIGSRTYYMFKIICM